MRRVALFYMFITLMSGLKEDSWTLMFTSEENVLWCVVSIEIYWENLASHRWIVEKYLIDNQGYFSTPKIDKWLFLKG